MPHRRVQRCEKDSLSNRLTCGSCYDPDYLDDSFSGNTTHLDKSTTVEEYFRGKLLKEAFDGEATAIECLDRALTFNEIHQFSTRIALDIIDRVGDEFVNKNPDGDYVVAVLLPPSERVVVSILAIWKAGFTYLPLDSTLPEYVLYNLIKTFSPIAILTDENSKVYCKFDTPIWEHDFKVLCYTEVWFSMSLPPFRNDKHNELQTMPVDPIGSIKKNPLIKRPAVIIHIFGFGDIIRRPCAVRISHTSILNCIKWSWKNFPLGSNAKACFSLATTDADSLSQIFTPLLKGHSLNVMIIPHMRSCEQLSTNLDTNKITRIMFHSRDLVKFLMQFRRLRDENMWTLNHLEYIFCLDTLTDKTADLFFTVFPKGKTLVALYSAPEFCGILMCEILTCKRDVKEAAFEGHITYGECIDNTQVYILDEKRKRLKPEHLEELGRIYISGPQVPMGFLANQCDGHYSFHPNKFSGKSTGYPTMIKSADFGRMKIGADQLYRLFLERDPDMPVVNHSVPKFLRQVSREFTRIG